MRFPSFLTKSKFVNLEIKDYVIRFAEIKNHSPLVVSHFGERHVPKGIIENGHIIDEQSFSNILGECIKSWHLKRKFVRFIVPDSSVIIRKVEIPAHIPNDEIQGHLFFELDHTIHLPFEQPVLDAILLNETEEKKDVLLVAAPNDVVQTISNYLREYKTNPVVADISPMCQYRLFHQFELTNEIDHFLLVQFDMTSVTVSIFDHHRPIFMQQFQIPYRKDVWNPELSDNGKVIDFTKCEQEQILEAIQDIFIEIDRIFRFYQYSLHNGLQEITKLLLSGDHPYFSQILHEIRNRYTIPVTVIPEEFTFNNQQLIEQKYYNVLGLGIREGI
ncbi:type IV pilus biogenesis protein PilM [Bacillus alveayuensis]|jgi:type IV pilus assembly protein PilM|uniref:type IV pilus biogenesis protein PilM n=1 Tax=Aeribacillus alveayuensis TaxID=279215 RepID=UPI0006971EE4|nr:pilus assembly protein PilM [Bacillus alveayuensis]